MKTMIRKKICFLAVAACVAVGAGLALNNDVVSASAAAEGIAMDNSASIRINSADYTGDIRFTATVSDDTLLTAEDKSCGIIVAKDDGTLTADNFIFNEDASDLVSTTQWMRIDSKDTGFSYNEGKKQFSLVVTDVPMANYNDNFAARAYVRNGSTYTYTDFTSRAISYVAQKAIQAKDSDLNDSTSEAYEYRPKVLNMMGDTLVTGTTVAGDLQLVDETTTIDIGAVEDTYSFAYNAGEYDLKLVRDTAIDYEYALKLDGSDVEKNLTKNVFYMNNGTTDIDVTEKLYWGKATTDKAKTDFMTVREDGTLYVDGTTGNADDPVYWWPQLRVDLTDGNEMVDDYFYGIAFNYNFLTLTDTTTSRILSGTANTVQTYLSGTPAKTKAHPYVAYQSVALGTGNMRGAFAFDADNDYGEANSCDSTFVNIFLLEADTTAKLTDTKFEITNLVLQQIPSKTLTGSSNTDGENNLQLSGDITNKWSPAWTNKVYTYTNPTTNKATEYPVFTSLWNANLGFARWGVKTAATTGFDPIPFLKWESSNSDVVDIALKHPNNDCATKTCGGHYDVVYGSSFVTGSTESANMHIYLQIDDGPIYSMLYRANIQCLY